MDCVSLRIAAVVAAAVAASAGPVLGRACLEYGFPLSITIEASGTLVVTDGFSQARMEADLMRVDPLTGDRTVISDSNTGVGPLLIEPRGVVVVASGDLVVSDSFVEALMRVNPVTGDRTIISDASTGTGPLLGFPLGIAVEGGGDLVVAELNLDVILRVDPFTGDRTILSGSGLGAGPAFGNPVWVAVEASGDLVVTDEALNAVVRVDATSGDRTIVSGSGIGSGPDLDGPQGIAIDGSGDLLVTNVFSDSVVRVDHVTGDRTIVSDASTGTGTAFGNPRGIAVEASGGVVVVDSAADEVVRVDPVSGDRAALECTNLPCDAKKLVVVDKLVSGGKAKVVFVSKDPVCGIRKGPATDASAISAGFTFGYDGVGGSVDGTFVVPQGEKGSAAAGWQVNKSTVAKYVNTEASGGATGAKATVIRPDKVLKIVGETLGDTPADLITGGAPVGPVVTVFTVQNGDDTFHHCSSFDPSDPTQTVTFKDIAGGTGRKLIARKGRAAPCP